MPIPSFQKHIGAVVFITLIWAGLLHTLFPINPLPPGDPQSFDSIAQKLLDKHIIQESWSNYRSWRAPGYPTFVAMVYALFGQNPQVVIWIQYVLWGLLNACIYSLGFMIWKQRKVAWWGVFLSLLYLPIFYFASLFYAETLFLFLVGLALWATLTYIQKNTAPTYWGIGVGIIWGLAILTRTALLYFPVFALGCAIIYACFKRSTTHIPGRKALFICAGIILTIAPWTTRNYLVHNQFLLTGSYGGYNLFMTQYPLQSYPKWPGRIPAHLWPEIDTIINQVRETQTEVQQDRTLSKMALDIISEYPTRFIYKCGSEFLKFYTYAGAYGQGYVRYMSFFQYISFIGAAIIGYCTLSNRTFANVLGMYIIYFGLIHAITFSMGRLKEAIMPAIFLLAVQGAYTIWRRILQLKSSRTPSN